MRRAPFIILAIALLTAGCESGTQENIRALETRVAELSAPQPTATPAPTATPSRATSNLSTLEDGTAFVTQLAARLESEGWEILQTGSDSINIQSPTARKFRLQYSYQSAEVSRLVIFTVWAGKGEANLACEALQAINTINDQYNLAKVSVDADGDVWQESVYPIGSALDVPAFLAYIKWYEETESVMVTELLADYVE